MCSCIKAYFSFGILSKIIEGNLFENLLASKILFSKICLEIPNKLARVTVSKVLIFSGTVIKS